MGCARLETHQGPDPKLVLQPGVDLDVLDEGGERIMPGSTAQAIHTMMLFQTQVL